ncbi:MAG: putative baseplate assembly protein, partial [Anaerolineae bacterium]
DGMSAKSTVLTLFQDDSSAPPAYNWWNAGSDGFSVIRGTVVYAQSEQLELAEEPIDDAIGADPDKPEEEEHARRIELGDYFEDLDSGRWIVVSGERLDIPGASGVKASELVMLAGVLQDVHKIEKNGQLVDLPGDTPHTTLLLANRLAFQYKRDTVTINGNVVKATNGETREQILGSGDSSQALQRFELNQKPLTHVSAATPNGIESTLQVRVNEVLWDQTDSLAEKPPDARVYVTHSDNENNTSVSFGNGEQGARLPTGVENVKAVYRVGTGEEGNVKANQISQLATKPVGVKEVINPLPATGGANREQPGQARINAPIPLKALERTVSVQDYADFARAFTGIGKASALRLSDGRREFVHLTIAGANDIAIDVQSDLYRNLRQALFRFGDPHQPLQIDLRELKLIIISARIQVLREFLWEKVEPRVRQHLLQTFGFASRDLGQDVTKSEVISAIQAVEGVDYVDLDILDAVGEEIIEEAEEEDNAQANEDSEENLILDKLADRLELKPRIFIHPARVDFSTTDPTRIIRPAQIAVLSPEIPDTFTLSELTR